MAAAPIAADCSRKYTAAHDSGERPVSEILWIVLHSTEGDTAQSAAAWFENPASSGSAHLCVDDSICYRTLLNTQVAWAAPGANTKGFHIEQAGYAAWTANEWRHHEATLRRAAYKTAFHARMFNIPLRWVAANSLALGRKGITTHAECTKAFGGTHTDPGAGYPKALFLRYAKEYADQIGNL